MVEAQGVLLIRRDEKGAAMPASLRGIGGSSRVGYRLLICSSMMMAPQRIEVEWVVVVKGCWVRQDDLDG